MVGGGVESYFSDIFDPKLETSILVQAEQYSKPRIILPVGSHTQPAEKLEHDTQLLSL